MLIIAKTDKQSYFETKTVFYSRQILWFLPESTLHLLHLGLLHHYNTALPESLLMVPKVSKMGARAFKLYPMKPGPSFGQGGRHHIHI